MGKFYLSMILLLCFYVSDYSQIHDKIPGKGRPRERIEQLEKIKLLEILNLDEETILKFFTRRNLHQEDQRKIMEERNMLLREIEKSIKWENKGEKKADYKELVERVMNIEGQMIQKRKEFIKTLGDILTEEQIAKLIVFEFNFRKEVRDALLKERRRN